MAPPLLSSVRRPLDRAPRRGAPRWNDVAAWAALALLVTVHAAPLAAQMPGLPVLQSGFLRPGGAAAVNYASGEGLSVLGAAGAWTPTSARFQLSLGLGVLSPTDGARRTTGGVRAAVPIGTPWTGRPTSVFGLAVFAGAGGSSLEEGGVVQVPAGVGLGYRRRLGATRALALFVTPSYTWTRRTGSDGIEGVSDESNLFRTSVGGDVVVTERFGVTAGYEFGSTADAGAPGPAGGIFGVAVTYLF